MYHISIIIPIYKAEQYIERCILSILQQSFRQYELILIDDASPDKSYEIAKQLVCAHKVSFQSIRHASNMGQSVARNQAVKQAQGNYIMFVDSDDRLAHTEVLQQFFDRMQDGKYDFVAANENTETEAEGVQKSHWIKGYDTNRALEDEKILTALLKRELSVSPWNKLINKQFFIQNNLFFAQGLRFEDDLWAFELCSAANTCFCLSDYNYNYNRSNYQSTIRSADKKAIDEYLEIIKRLLQSIEKHNSHTTQDIRDIIFFLSEKTTSLLNIAHHLYPKDTLQWEHYYGKIKHMYNNSILSQHKKLFFLPSQLAATIFYVSKKAYPYFVQYTLLLPISLLNKCNLRGKYP